MADGQVVFEISGDNRNIRQALDDTTNAIESESKKWDKAAGNGAKGIENRLKEAFRAVSAAAAAVKAGRALRDFGVEAIRAARREIGPEERPAFRFRQAEPEGAEPSRQKPPDGTADRSGRLMTRLSDAVLKAGEAFRALIDAAGSASEETGRYRAAARADDPRAPVATGSREDAEKRSRARTETADRREGAAAPPAGARSEADAEFRAVAEAAQKAAAGLDVYSDAKGAMERTVQGIADGIEAKVSAVQTQVDALNAALSNIGAGLGGFLGSAFSYVPKLAIGMDYVPFDNYLAQLHEGESVLTAEEAKVWRAFKNGGSAVANTIDYDAMGGVMRDNIKPGGNVYLDGRIVGEVISTRQGNSLRQLERSGWQK